MYQTFRFNQSRISDRSADALFLPYILHIPRGREKILNTLFPRGFHITWTGSIFLDFKSHIFTVLSIEPDKTSVDSSLNLTQLTVPANKIGQNFILR
jgi:hypothetical protein